MKSNQVGLSEKNIEYPRSATWGAKFEAILNQLAVSAWGPEAVSAYRKQKEVGEVIDNPQIPFPQDGKFEWHTVDTGRKVPGYYHSTTYVKLHVKYSEGLGDKAWMKKKAEKYKSRLQQEPVTKHENTQKTPSSSAARGVDLTMISEGCQYLPPITYQRIASAVASGASQGFMRATSTILGNSLSRSYGQVAGQVAMKAAFYSMYFSSSYLQYANMDDSTNTLNDEWYPFMQAAANTLNFALFDSAVSIMSSAFGWISHRSEQAGYSRIAATTGFFARQANKAVLSYQVYQQGPLEIGTSIAAGTAVEIGIRRVANLF